MTPVASEGVKPSNTMGVARRQTTGQVFLTNQIVSLCGLDPTEARVMELLPTPAASVANDGEGVETWDARRERIKAKGINGNGMGEPLTIAAQRLLPTPSANIGENGGSQHPDKRRAGNHQPSIQDVAEHVLLPTPQAHDAQKGKTREQVAAMRAKGHGVANLNETAENELAPGDSNANSTETGPGEDLQGVRTAIHSAPLWEATGGPHAVPIKGTLQPVLREHQADSDQISAPVASQTVPQGGLRELWDDRATACPSQGSELGERRPIESPDAVCELSSKTPLARGSSTASGVESMVAWGPYEPAIRRWESVLGRPSPAPTEPNSKGAHRLSPKFTEFLMGVPEGWITSVEISRNEQLKACGNGVVPAQAAAALKDMLEAFG